MDKTTHPYFVPDDTAGNRKETAILLVGTATEGDAEGPIPQREVAATQGGFRISQRVYSALGWDEDDESPDQTGVTETRMSPAENGSVFDSGQSERASRTREEAEAKRLGTEDPHIADVSISDDGFQGTDPDADQVDSVGDTSPAQGDDPEQVPTAEDETEAIDAEVPDYDEWEYADLRTEVKNRDINTTNLQADTLIAALRAYDEAYDSSDEQTAEPAQS